MKIGVLVHLNNSINTQLEELSAMGIKSCQLVCWDQDKMTKDTAQLVKAAAGKLGEICPRCPW